MSRRSSGGAARVAKFLPGGEVGIPKLDKIARTAQRQIDDDNNLLMCYGQDSRVITCLAIDGAGKHFAVGSIRGDLHVHDLATGERLASMPPKGAVYAVKFHPDGKRLAGGGSGRPEEARGYKPSNGLVSPMLRKEGSATVASGRCIVTGRRR